MAGGISNKQAKFLADLQRQLGEPYSGSGMTAFAARLEITRLLARREQLLSGAAQGQKSSTEGGSPPTRMDARQARS